MAPSQSADPGVFTFTTYQSLKVTTTLEDKNVIQLYTVQLYVLYIFILEAEGKGTKASEGKCGNVKRGVVGRVQSCLGTPSTLCLSSTFKR